MKKQHFFLLLISLALGGMSCTNTLAPTTTHTPVSLDDEEAVAVETADVYGKDLDLIARYPDSIRSYYSSNEYETDVTYQTTADTETVRQYFNDQLTAAGWTNSEEATDYMEYTKGEDRDQEILTVYFTEYNNNSVLEYELVYEPPLPDKKKK